MTAAGPVRRSLASNSWPRRARWIPCGSPSITRPSRQSTGAKGPMAMDEPSGYEIQERPIARVRPPSTDEDNELKFATPLPVATLNYISRPVICPACETKIMTAVVGNQVAKPRKSKKEVAGKMSLMLAFTGCLLLPCSCCIASSLYHEKPTYASQFCHNCGIRLVYWHGETILCAKTAYLTETAAAASDVGSSRDVPSQRWVSSPLGPPPQPGQRLYEIPATARPSELGVRRILKLDRGEVSYGTYAFIREIRDSTDDLIFTIPVPEMEAKEWYDGPAFAPSETGLELLRRPGDIPPRDAAPATMSIYREENRKDLAVTLGFHRRSWVVDILYYPKKDEDAEPGELSSDKHEKLTPHDGPSFKTRLFFLFTTERGPLAWTEVKSDGLRPNIVLIDAYDRIAGTYSRDEDSISIFGPAGNSDRFVEQIAAAFIAITVQKFRFSAWSAARSNEIASMHD
ncbi:hypothetical protein GQ53DRAFT_746609 [Thozetella sp. PMI_491]|nr:hypothetical protein GQ53DRAFT_746609 [Thozetella sp. PMI_491]